MSVLLGNLLFSIAAVPLFTFDYKQLAHSLSAPSTIGGALIAAAAVAALTLAYRRKRAASYRPKKYGDYNTSDLPVLDTRAAQAMMSASRGDARPSHNTQDELADVDISVFAPPSARPGQLLIIQVLLHLAEEFDAVAQHAVQNDPKAERLANLPLLVQLAIGDSVTLAIETPDLEIENRTFHSCWEGDTVEWRCLARLPTIKSSGEAQAKLYVRINGRPAACARLKIDIQPDAYERTPRPILHQKQYFRKIFISYAEPDRVSALKAAQVLGATGVDCFQDLLSLKPGQQWEKQLFEQIDSSDMFMLMWSNNSAQSKWVRKEFMHALSRHERTPMGPLEIVPVLLDGPPIVQPPPELAHLHFNDPVRHIIYAELIARNVGA